MSVTPDLLLEAQLDPYRRTMVSLDGLEGYWRLGESSGVTAVDASGNGRDGTYVNAPTLGAAGALADGDTAVTLNGTDERITVASSALNLTAGPLSLILWAKRGTGSSDAGLAGTSLSLGYQLNWHNGATVYFYCGGSFISFPLTDATAFHLIVGTWDGTTDADGLKLYIDGVLVAQGTAATTTLSATGFEIGQSSTHFAGSLDEVGVLSRVLTATEIEQFYALRTETVWADITDDLELRPSGLQFRRGVDGNGPQDVVAGGGSLRFSMDNSERNQGGLQGWYSPNHDNCRAGWGFDIPIRLTFLYGSPDRQHFTGTIRVIQPDPGIYGEQRVHVEAYDLMRDLIDSDIREIDIAVDQSEDEVIDAVLDLLPDEAQPDSRDLDAGVDTFPYVFDRLGPDTKMATPIADAARSSFGLFAITGDGTPMFRSRHTRALGSSTYTFEALRNVVIPSTLDSVYRVVRSTVHPKTVDPAATSVLYALEGDAPALAPGETLTIWGEYRDTTDNRSLIGGLDRVVPIVQSTDYLGNSLADGSGTDLTSSLSIVTSDFATTAKFEITNTGMALVFLTLLQIRGKRVLDIGAQTFQSGSSTDRRTRPLLMDLPLQADPFVGQSAADFVRSQYGDARRQISEISFLANYSAELMEQFMTLEIGDRIAVTEEQTGLDEVEAVIQSIDADVGEAMTVVCRYGLAPVNPIAMWQWGIVGASEWGETTVYAF